MWSRLCSRRWRDVDIKLPKLGLTMESAELTSWLVTVGDTVEEGESIAEITTDKIDHEIEAPAAGTIVELVAAEGDELEVGVVIARLETD